MFIVDLATIRLQVPVPAAPDLRAQVDRHQLAVRHQLPSTPSIPGRDRGTRDLFRGESAVHLSWIDAESPGKSCRWC